MRAKRLLVWCAVIALSILWGVAVARAADPPAGPIEPGTCGKYGEETCLCGAGWVCQPDCTCSRLDLIIDDPEPVGRAVRMAREKIGHQLPVGIIMPSRHGELSFVSWPGLFTQLGACDTVAECYERVDEMCDDAGHGGAQELTATITQHADGSRTCSADCIWHGAVGFVTCHYSDPTPEPEPTPDPPTTPPPDTPDTVVDEPDPTSVQPERLCDQEGDCGP